jgi:hypothetical protein
MGKMLVKGNMRIGAMQFPDRKLPSIVVERGNEGCVYGHFHSIEGADEFMEILAGMVGAQIENKANPEPGEIDFDYTAED